MAQYNHDSIVPFKDSDLAKKQQIATMFDKIAFRYDILNRTLSGGIDLYWRKKAIKALTQPAAKDSAPFRPKVILDVATGTGDMAIMIDKYLSPEKITGIDISTGMLEFGRQKIAKLRLEDKIVLQQGDSEAITFSDNSFDAITVAFGVRNFENLEKGLKEMYRVLRPGGKLVILEFSQPKTPGIRQLYTLYNNVITLRVGKMLSKSKEAYKYLNDSVKAFPEGQNFVNILNTSGYKQTRMKRLTFGICTIYIGTK